MGDKTGIEWTDATWNPVRGCSKVSEGCRNCYAMGVAARFSGVGQPYEGLAERTATGPKWTGEIMLVEDALELPLRWKRPRRVFVNSMSDLFHPDVPDEFIELVFAVMAICPQHTFQVLTKRPLRMWAFVSRILPAKPYKGECHTMRLGNCKAWPLPNVWLGVSCEDQNTADERIPTLLSTPAAVRFLSCEPLLGPVDLERGGFSFLRRLNPPPGNKGGHERGIDWVIVGGESGPNARLMQKDWVQRLRSDCVASGVPFFFKQWGEYNDYGKRVGKKAAGALLDEVEHREFPVVRG